MPKATKPNGELRKLLEKALASARGQGIAPRELAKLIYDFEAEPVPSPNRGPLTLEEVDEFGVIKSIDPMQQTLCAEAMKLPLSEVQRVNIRNNVSCGPNGELEGEYAFGKGFDDGPEISWLAAHKYDYDEAGMIVDKGPYQFGTGPRINATRLPTRDAFNDYLRANPQGQPVDAGTGFPPKP